MKPLLDLRHLQLIQAVIETGRITDAAKKLGVTPSALSHRLREAERRLDVPLFTRMHKKLRRTPAADYMAVVARADSERPQPRRRGCAPHERQCAACGAPVGRSL